MSMKCESCGKEVRKCSKCGRVYCPKCDGSSCPDCGCRTYSYPSW